jgi:hypothetical protein
MGMMWLAVSEQTGPDFLPRAVAQLQLLPRVARVRVVPEQAQLEVIFQQPAPELLRQIHRALQVLRQEPVPSGRLS